MKENIVQNLTSKEDKYACAFADKIILESKETDEWYEYFDDFASLLNHPKSLVRNRVIYILATNAQWDEDNHFDLILDDYLAHITDEKPITSRQCIKALAQVGLAKPQYIPQILSALHNADLSKYKDSMRPLIEKDITETEKVLKAGDCKKLNGLNCTPTCTGGYSFPMDGVVYKKCKNMDFFHSLEERNFAAVRKLVESEIDYADR